MSYDLNKLVKLSALQQLIEKIKSIFATKEEITQIPTLPEINDKNINYILKVNNDKKAEWSIAIPEIRKIALLNLFSPTFDSDPNNIASIDLYADGSAANPVIHFEGDSNNRVILRNLALPIIKQDAASKEYVDNQTPLYIIFSGTTDNNDAICNTSWQDIKNAIINNKLIVGKYIASDGTSFILNIDYRADYLHGDFIKFNNLENPEDYLQIKVIMEENNLSIIFIDNL